MAVRITEWSKLPIPLTELCLATTLRCGQSFRWRQDPLDQTWLCTLRGRLIQLRQESDTQIDFRSIWPIKTQNPASTTSTTPKPPIKVETPLSPPPSIPPEDPFQDQDDTHQLLTHYLTLRPNLQSLYSSWSAADTNFRKKASRFAGIRILTQSSWEALICFICSSNNNIIRISQMVENLCRSYGEFVCSFAGREWYDFPAVERLVGDEVEKELRDLGFGYRARYIASTARMVRERGEGWLDSLRNPEVPGYGGECVEGGGEEVGEWKVEGRDGYRRAHEAVLELQGVGPKVADCVCLMGLGWREAIPVDTHVWQIAQRDYKFAKGRQTMRKGDYEGVGDLFREFWGVEAGWAHSVLFAADLRVFKERLKEEVKQEVVVKSEGSDKENVVKRVVKIETAVIKTEPGEEIKRVLNVDESIMTAGERVKRRRRA